MNAARIFARTLTLATLVAATTFAVAQPSGRSAQPFTVSAPQASAPSKTPASAPALLDINTASQAQLASLPGIGAVYSAKIMAGRTYSNKTQLVSKGILPQATYNKIQALIIAKQK